MSLSRRAAASAALDVSPRADLSTADIPRSDVSRSDVLTSDAGSSTEPSLFAPVLRPIRSGNAFEETVERLLHTIKLGVVPPGQRLPAERDLANRLRVSRETLRDAIGSLREAGYLESRRGRSGGTFVVTDSVPGTRNRPTEAIGRSTQRPGRRTGLPAGRRVGRSPKRRATKPSRGGAGSIAAIAKRLL